MHPNPRRILPVILVLGLAGAAYWYLQGRASEATVALTASGTIEAVEIAVGPEIAGRVRAVLVDEGDPVQAGEALVEFDRELLEAQRQQAEAAAEAALAASAAAEANYELLLAGPSPEQLAVAQTVVDRAQLSVDAAREAYEALPEVIKETAEERALRLQLEQAMAALENARAQYELAQAGARPEQLEAAQAQAEAASAQAEAAQAAISVLDVQMRKLTLLAPAGGVVLARTIHPGEVAAPGQSLLVIGRLDSLTLTVYVPEDVYGAIRLGQTAAVTVDSYPGETFRAAVELISDRAEFTPRNVQTAEGRRSTVFAVRLSLENPEGKLKPGMPADVAFEGS